jgi:ADP-ribose pyrophosphatase YjhB (NUDIX family)
MKLTTLCYPIVNGHVLLAMKKRGFGSGKWNGPGGKVQQGEMIEDACRREVVEETGVRVHDIEPVGIVESVFDGRPDWDNECHVFVVRNVEGDIHETDEMRPRWFGIDQVPYQEMWEDDAIWLPEVLRGGNVNKRFYFDAEMKLIRHEDLPRS